MMEAWWWEVVWCYSTIKEQWNKTFIEWNYSWREKQSLKWMNEWCPSVMYSSITISHRIKQKRESHTLVFQSSVTCDQTLDSRPDSGPLTLMMLWISLNLGCSLSFTSCRRTDSLVVMMIPVRARRLTQQQQTQILIRSCSRQQRTPIHIWNYYILTKQSFKATL